MKLFTKLADKTLMDCWVFLMRKVFLWKVKIVHYVYGEKYFFSTRYIRKSLLSSSRGERRNFSLTSHLCKPLFGDMHDVDKRLEAFCDKNPSIKSDLMKCADRYVRHEFNLLGSGAICLNFPAVAGGVRGVRYEISPRLQARRSPSQYSEYKPLDWLLDFKSGYRWDPAEYYPSARAYTQIRGADIKVPWELSRCQHFCQLALAYRITKDERYSKEILSQIIDWILNNPLCRGPNWNCPMDVAIRLANWMVALELVQDSSEIQRFESEKLLLGSLVQHVRYLQNNSEWTSRLTSNHYLSDITGLLFGVIYLKRFKGRSKAIISVVKELEGEIRKQNYADGINSEGSLSYHRLVTELFCYSAILAKRNGIELSDFFMRSLKKSLRSFYSILRQNGDIVQIGDNDSGVFLKFIDRSPCNCAYMLALGSVLFEDIFPGDSSIESAIFGGKLERQATCGISVNHYEDAGLVVVKSENIHFTLYNGDNGQKGNGGHCHNDRNSVTLVWQGEVILEDPGTGFYTAFPEIRNRFRSTQSHCTVSIDGQEQNRFLEDTLFKVNLDVTDRKIAVEVSKSEILIVSEHNGYQRLGPNLQHKRTIRIVGERHITIIDEFADSAFSKMAHFLVPNSPVLEVLSNGLRSRSFSMLFEGNESMTFQEYSYSPGYGCIEDGQLVRFDIGFSRRLVTTLILF